MSNGKQRTPTDHDEEVARAEAKSDRRDRRQANADEKRSRVPETRGLRSQGDVGIVESDHPFQDNPRGRRAEPNRFDAMPIAGHQRLRGYDAEVTTRDERALYPVRPDGSQPKAPAGPDAMTIQPDEARDLQQSSENAVRDAVDDAEETAFDEAAFDEHVASLDLPPRSRSRDDDEDEDHIF